MGIMSFKGTMLANLFKKPVTIKYPAEPIDFPEGSRGHIEIEIDKCISCALCALNCPSGAIKVDRKARTWEINRMDCVQCGYCTMKCPKKCLHIVPGYTEPDGTKQIDKFVRPPEPPKPAAAAGKPAAAPAAKKPEAAAAAAQKPAAAPAAKKTEAATAAAQKPAAAPAAQKPETAAAEKKSADAVKAGEKV